ncbi:MAG TPA: histidine kinase dimerization/phospho-acceptor domain-containing protein [Pyrinomonadaceae bacterium]|nr:histidine kinase dimerization/phospho-acceptor domain-containing protein [Pyrinomonadaceae bacterium]
MTRGLMVIFFRKSAPRKTGTRIDESAVEGGGSRWPDPEVSRAWINQVLKTASNIPHRPMSADEVILRGECPPTDFAKGMSHELHTPLHVIIGLCQLLAREQNPRLSPMQRDAVERMERNARTLLQSVNHLLGCLRSGQFE